MKTVTAACYLAIAVSVSAVSPASSSGSSDPPKEIVTVTASAEADLVHLGEVTKIELRVVVADGWHINARKPELDYLIPTKVALAKHDGVALVDVTYPEPKKRKLAFSDKVLSVLDGELDIEATVRFSDAATPGLIALKGHVRYQACNDEVCLRPTKAEFSVPLMLAN